MQTPTSISGGPSKEVLILQIWLFLLQLFTILRANLMWPIAL